MNTPQVSSRAMTIMGGVLSAAIFTVSALPDGTPAYIQIPLGAIVAGLTQALAYSHPGTGTQQGGGKDGGT